MIWKDARIIRDNDSYILAFIDDNPRYIICGGRFSTKKDAETALHIATIIGNQDGNTDRRITRKLQAFIDDIDSDEDEELELWV